jgi:voltage-gated potassium channel
MLTRWLVYFAYFLQTSERYQKFKRFFFDLLENTQSRSKRYFDVFMIMLVMASVILMIADIDEQAGYIQVFFEKTIVILFMTEYGLRFWVYSDNHKIIIDRYEKADYLNIPFHLAASLRLVLAKKLDYVTSPLSIIDLLALLPSYRALRFMRVFLIFRLFKLFRYVDSIQLFTQILTSKRFELYTLAVFLGFLIFIGSISFFLFENSLAGGKVDTLFDAVYWSVVTLSTVGYGDIIPKSTGGRLVAMALIFTGLGVLSFFTSIIVSAFNDRLLTLQENRIYAELKRLDNLIIICGFGRVGRPIAALLEKNKQAFVVIEKEGAKAAEARRRNYLTIHADACKNDVLQKAGIEKNAVAVLCTAGNDITNVYITLTSRQLKPSIRILARANDNANIKKLYQAGADHVIQPFDIAGRVAAEYVGQPAALEAILGIMREDSHYLIEALPIQAGTSLDNNTIAGIGLAQSKLTLLGVISHDPPKGKKYSYPLTRRHFYFNPELDFRVKHGDLLVVLGHQVSIDYFRYLIEKSRLK